jgi:UDP-2,3-diacylglucosamine hydrolase
LDLLAGEACSADALYILGDFFEVWLGDDDDSALGGIVASALKTLSDSGVLVYLLHGNRDLLMGVDFCQRAGCELLSEPIKIDLYGKPVLLLHGDSLCTEDHSYMEFRAMVRNPQWQQQFLAKPLAERKLIAQHMREVSKQTNSNKAMDIMDVTGSDVLKTFEAYAVDLMIHGHTHRPDIHKVEIPSGIGTRIVLGDWEQYGWVLRYKNDHSYKLDKFSIPSL